MKITIEESPKSKWIFDTDDMSNPIMREHIEKHVDNMMKPIRELFEEHGEIQDIEVVGR